MLDRLTRIAIVSNDRCKPKKCRQECKKSFPVIRTGRLCNEVSSASKIAYIFEELCIGCGICVKPADIYLIDEPSAYLDSEQCIIAAKVIKRFILHAKKTAFVVEHDFIMATYLADRFIVYEGKPSIDCIANCPQSLLTGMNLFLSELEKLLDVLRHSHELLSRDLSVDSFSLMLNEMQENISLVSFSSRLASQIWSQMQSDFLPNFFLCNTTQRFIRSSKTIPVQKPTMPPAKDV